MVKVTEYKDDQFMVNVTKEEALRIIKSLAAQLYNDDCNRDRVEFGKRHEDDSMYFSIAVDESKSKFYVMTNLIDGIKMNDMTLYKSDNLEDAQKFIKKFTIEIEHSAMWIKEVTT